MKRRRNVMFVLFVAIGAALATHTTPAQQLSSGAASATIRADEPAAINSKVLFRSELDEKSNPLQQSDRAHADSTRRLLAEYQAASHEAQRSELSDELEKVITEHFEIRQKLRAQELEELQAQVRRLQELHDLREREKDQIVSDHLRRLLRDADGLGWGSSDAAGTGSLGLPGGTFSRPRSATPVDVPR
jgi:type I site-specific restriction-modification system R (restriction) subunit